MVIQAVKNGSSSPALTEMSERGGIADCTFSNLWGIDLNYTCIFFEVLFTSLYSPMCFIYLFILWELDLEVGGVPDHQRRTDD